MGIYGRSPESKQLISHLPSYAPSYYSGPISEKYVSSYDFQSP